MFQSNIVAGTTRDTRFDGLTLIPGGHVDTKLHLVPCGVLGQMQVRLLLHMPEQDTVQIISNRR